MEILGLQVSEISLREVLGRVSEWVKGQCQRQIVSVNPEGVLLAQKDARYREAVNRAALTLADGAGIMIALRLLNYKLQITNYKTFERITGIDLMLKLCALAGQNGWRVYLVGGAGETAARAAEKLRMKFPGLVIEGEEGVPRSGKLQITNYKLQINPKFQIPNSRFSTPDSETAPLINRINDFKPQILFIALGQPRQELWIDAHLKEMPSVRVAMGVGGAFDVISGKVPRAPLSMQKMGIEWLWRLIVQPWRFSRIFNATVRFMWLVVRERFNVV